MNAIAHPHAHGTTVASRLKSLVTTEVGLVRLATGVVALQVVDDNFLQPNPGMSAGDHLVGGSIQLALLVAGAAAYGRVRAGARGAIALLLGFFGLLVSTEGVYYASEGELSGDDYTGLLAIPAGFTLIAVGAVALWRSRKGGGLARRWLRRAVLTLACVVAVPFGLFPLAQAYVVTHAARAYVPEPQLGVAFEDVSFRTSDGLHLQGWYVPSKNGAAVVSFPGRAGSQKPARILARHGYGVLLFDRRGEGQSEGDPNQFGWRGTRDLAAAAAFLRSRPDVDADRIGGVGLSVGGEVLLQAAAETDDFKAVVSEGAGIRSVREAVHLPGAQRIVASEIFALSTLGTAAFTSDLPPPSLIDLSARVTEPLLVIHADPGAGGETLSREYYAAAKGPKELWQAPGGHIGAIEADPEAYERRIVDFFDQNLLGS
jgi:fermentation-respiration switch protein FrsA (DUF1100 family)